MKKKMMTFAAAVTIASLYGGLGCGVLGSGSLIDFAAGLAGGNALVTALGLGGLAT
jgi:hypothetical protein